MADTLVIEKEIQDTELPFLTVKKIVKKKLSQIQQDQQQANVADKNKEYQVQRDALLAFGESTRAFLGYVVAIAGDIAKDNKRQTLMPEDIFKALEEIDCLEYIEPLREALQGIRDESKEKKEQKKEIKKRKTMDKADMSADNTNEVQYDHNQNELEKDGDINNHNNKNDSNDNNGNNYDTDNDNDDTNLDDVSNQDEDDNNNLDSYHNQDDNNTSNNQVGDNNMDNENSHDNENNNEDQILEHEFMQLLGDGD